VHGEQTTVVLTTKVEARAGGPLLVVKLENQGQPVWAYGLLDFEDYDCAARPRASLQISLRDARGRTLRSSCRPLIPNYLKDHHRVVEQGGDLSASLALASCYQVEKGETLTLAAFYADPTDTESRPAAGAVALRRRISAPPLSFVVP
jgi:hypothetical protein